ncbi:hypothetical protein XELAEV_18016783mg [Xenopus laevis]|uniref:CCHC-type domain-containing protein n=1 Tax=Xenopus laevis TaxID=8355 RepID=A0A974HS86_XENLA|nr:hypothetical protein XELAEV_18016783mg [Xenopus laevis]
MSGTSPGPTRAGRATHKTEAQALGPSHVAEISRPRLRSSSAGTPTTPRGKTSSESEMEKFVAETRRQKQRSAAAARAQEVEARRGAPKGKINPPGAAKTNKGKKDGKQCKAMQGKQVLVSDGERNQQEHKGMEMQTVPLISSETDYKLQAVSVEMPEKKQVNVIQTNITAKRKETVQNDLNFCQNPAQKCVTGACEQQGIQGCAEKQAEAPLCELESVGQVGEESGEAINPPVYVLQQTCQETGTPDTAARPCTGAPTSPDHGADSACSSGGRRSAVCTIAPLYPLSSEGSSPGVSPGPSIDNNTSKGVACKAQEPVKQHGLCKLGKAHGLCEGGLTEEKVLSLKGTDTKEPKIKGKVKEMLTAEKVAEALKELATLQNKKKKLQLSIKSLTNKRDELRGELADIDFQISELYKDVGPWKEIYQNKQRFETMGSNIRGSVSKPVLQKSHQASTSNSPGSSESETEFIKPLPPKIQRNRGKVNWQNMAFDQQDVDNQEKSKSVIKTFKVNKPKQDLQIERTFELSSDQDFPDLPKVKGKLNVKSPCESASVRSEKQHEGVLEAGEESEMEVSTKSSTNVKESGTMESGTVEIGALKSGTVESSAVEIGTMEIGAMEIGAMESGTVEIGAVEIGAMESGLNGVMGEGVQGRSCESGRVEVQVNGNAGNPSAGELAGNRQVQVDQVETVSVEVESIQVGDGMRFSPDDLSAVMAQTDIDFDVTFKLPEALDHFWKIYNVQKRAGHQNWDDLVVIPMTKPETKNITIIMKNDAIPQEDILVWLRRQCTVLTPLVKIYDEDNVWAGAWRTQVKLEVVGNVPTHLPNSFFIGKEKGTCFYVGQPRRCFKCGAGNHLARVCKVLKCALCNATGHEAESCDRVRCNLCNRMDHSHRRCPEAYHNIFKLFPEIDREMRREMQPVGGEREQEQDTEPPHHRKVFPKSKELNNL